MKEKKKTEKSNKEERVNKEEKVNIESEGKKKINFFKKIGYSIGKISKYDDMINLGVKSAIKYFFGLLAIASLIIAIGFIIGILIMISMQGIEVLGEDISTTSVSYILIYNGLVYFLAYYVMLFIFFVIFILIIPLTFFLTLKILKRNFTFKQALCLTIYITTLPLLVYAVYILTNYFIENFSIPYFDAVVVIIMCIYLWLFIRTKRKEWKYGFYRTSKKESKK